MGLTMTSSADPTSRMPAGYHGSQDLGRSGIAKYRVRVSRPALRDNPDRHRSVVVAVDVPVPAVRAAVRFEQKRLGCRDQSHLSRAVPDLRRSPAGLRIPERVLET